MISVTCDQCGNGHDYAAWLAGMRVQCKGCKAWVNVPRPEGSKVPTPAPAAQSPPPPPAPVQSWRQTVAEEKFGPTPTRPVGISEAELTRLLNNLQAAAATPEEMVTELVETGCSQTFAAQFVAKFLRGEVHGHQSLHAVASALSIVGLEGMTESDLREEMRKGGRFVVYQHCYSVIVYSSKQPSDIHFVRSSGSRFQAGLPFTLRSLLLGWWGLPWGAIFTVWCVGGNCLGGSDVTPQVLDALGWRNQSGSR